MSKNKAEVDCTRRCKSRSHGQALTSAITKRSSSDEALACFIKATCANFVKAFDFEGRTALHMSASRGRARLMDWLVRHSSVAFINARDRESGYTPLHRSIFYGQIHAAVSLMKIGVNTDIVDKDDYKALEHAMLDRQYMYKHAGSGPSEVYVWGSNSNYTLGTGTQQQRNVPELLGCFNRTNVWVKQVCLGKFHSIWVCEGAGGPEVYVCGQTARAGGAGGTALRPAPLRLPEPCLQAALTRACTVLLLDSGAIVQYCLNNADASQSANTPSAIKLPSTKPLLKISKPIGVVAARSHVAVWNAHAVYTWGTNLGQLGHSQEDKVVPAPKRVAISVNNKEEAGLQLVGVGDAATVITTCRGDVYLLHKYICKKIAIKQINVSQVCVEAKVSEHGVYSRVTVLLLTNVGQLLIWQDTTAQLTRCVFGLSHQTVITHVALTHDALYFTTKYGEAFIGSISRKAPPSKPQPIRKERERDNNKSALVKFLEKDDCTPVRITKVPNVHRAVAIAVDSEGLNFACLQIKPTCGLTSIPELSPTSMSKHMESLMETASTDDLLHDIVFKVDTRLYPAHVYIIASHSDLLYKLYQDIRTSKEDKPLIVLDNVLPDVFERILRYMYTGTCDVAELGPCSLKIRREDLNNMMKKEKDVDLELDVIENPTEISAFEVYKQEKNKKGSKTKRQADGTCCDPVKLLQAAAKRLQVMGLHKLLDKFYYRDGTVYLRDSATFTKNPSPVWDRTRFPELVDTTVCSKDGGVTAAHKCVLAARLEYFHGMFMHSWTESKLLSKVTLPINQGILQPIINFLYTDSCPEVTNSDSVDFICSMLIVADQLFISRLREMCEVALSNLLNLKNCAELCQFAHTYNATQLKQCCMEFISLNLCSILENRTLELIEDNVVEDISRYYCKFNPIMSSRVITPFYNAPSDDVIDDCAANFPVHLELTDEDVKNDSMIDNKDISKKKSKAKKIEYTESEKARMRYESVSSVTSLDLSNEVSGDITLSLSNISKESEKGAREKQEKWIEVSSSQQKQQKVVQARLKAISNARDILNETPTESFTKLTKNNSSSSIIQSENVPTTSRISVSPKDSSIAEMAKSPNMSQGFVINHIGPKLSQKQRKKMALQGHDTPQRLDGYLNKLNIESPPEKPRNPWKVVETPAASSSPKAKAVEFNQILTDQKKQRDDYSRIMTKPLGLTQLEDKAIEDLERFYNVHEADDELITVRRIEIKVSSPQWIHTAPK
ncbi:inhibitor of Bruton tyrosine kinase [Plodia interpunctella]|uniref:inhibitor of Bruton tyrosine kinase n=1 Tax=Plodia interpunctella TaxID=58824 RepID=UPI00236847A5|nr:inhibitor of Bruton tyrosine kinase [Plodia interpunctella]